MMISMLEVLIYYWSSLAVAMARVQLIIITLISFMLYQFIIVNFQNRNFEIVKHRDIGVLQLVELLELQCFRVTYVIMVPRAMDS